MGRATDNCEHCASPNVCWFTPAGNLERAAVLLCMHCRRLTIVPPRGWRRGRAGAVDQAA
jgi:hypothetical protein